MVIYKSIAQYHIARYSMELQGTVWYFYSIVLHIIYCIIITLHDFILYYIVLYYNLLYAIVWYCMVFYDIVLCYMVLSDIVYYTIQCNTTQYKFAWQLKQLQKNL